MVVAGSLPTATRGGLAGRPAVSDTGVPGVWMAGDWVGPVGHLLDASVASAEAAATAAVRHAARHRNGKLSAR
jgi:thioredoxin reductase